MEFQTSSIDRAIVMTQYDLRGFLHPLGLRMKPMESAKGLDATTCNLLAFAAKKLRLGQGESVADYFESSYETYLVTCRQLAACCDLSEKEAIQLILREIVRQNAVMRAEVDAKKREKSPYLQPLQKDNNWGKAVLALAEAFGMSHEQLVAQDA